MKKLRKNYRRRRPNKQCRHYEFIDHTADIGLRVWAEDLNSLFIFAAQGMFEIIGRLRQDDKKPKVFEVRAEAADKEQLLVGWLSELLTLSDIHNVLLFNFRITLLSDNQIKANAEAVSLDNDLVERKTQIKAVTYHNLKIEQKNKDKLQAQIFFDI